MDQDRAAEGVRALLDAEPPVEREDRNREAPASTPRPTPRRYGRRFPRRRTVQRTRSLELMLWPKVQLRLEGSRRLREGRTHDCNDCRLVARCCGGQAAILHLRRRLLARRRPSAEGE